MADDKNRSQEKMLPKGWRKEVVQRKSGTSAGKYDTYIFSPDNRKLRSKVEVAAYIKEKKLNLSLDAFDFSHSVPKDLTTKVEKKEPSKEKDTESPAKKPRGRPSGTPGKLLVKMPFSDKKIEKATAMKADNNIKEKKKGPIGKKKKVPTATLR